MILAKGITAVSTPSGACRRLGSKVLLFAFQLHFNMADKLTFS